MSRVLPAVVSGVFSLFIITAAATMARADGDAASVDKSNSEHLKSETAELKNRLEELRSKIESYSAQVQTLSDPKTAQETVAALQSEISQALAATADNGKVEMLARTVLETEKSWLADLKTHNFAPERQSFLEQRFNDIIANTEKTVAGITAIRHELTATLKKLQGEQDYLEELARVNQGEEMTRVLQNLLADLKATSDNLKVLIYGVPGA